MRKAKAYWGAIAPRGKKIENVSKKMGYLL
jgi:hypothetical protein